MKIRIKCTTLFDITATGVKQRFNKNQIPFRDNTGQLVSNDLDWARSRNQQSNWETINQLISLRTLPEHISTPVKNAELGTWSFEFDIVTPDALFVNNDPMGYLVLDCHDVPMLTGLGEKSTLDPFIDTRATSANTWFELIG